MKDKELTADCGFLDTFPPFTSFMAEKGFSIYEECMERSLTLIVPPGKRGHVQMPSSAVRKTKGISNKRILVEQVIRQIKTFKLLQNELPLMALHNTDEVVLVCAAFSNLKKAIYSS